MDIIAHLQGDKGEPYNTVPITLPKASSLSDVAQQAPKHVIYDMHRGKYFTFHQLAEDYTPVFRERELLCV